MELRVGGCAFQQTYATLGHLATKIWVKSVWEGAECHGAKIECSRMKKLPLQRVNDEYIITVFRSAGYSGDQLAQLNRVRLSLQVYSLADITHPGGSHIKRRYFEEVLLDDDEASMIDFWRREKPAPPDIRLWKTALRKMSLQSFILE